MRGVEPEGPCAAEPGPLLVGCRVEEPDLARILGVGDVENVQPVEVVGLVEVAVIGGGGGPQDAGLALDENEEGGGDA